MTLQEVTDGLKVGSIVAYAVAGREQPGRYDAAADRYTSPPPMTSRWVVKVVSIENAFATEAYPQGRQFAVVRIVDKVTHKQRNGGRGVFRADVADLYFDLAKAAD